MDNCGIDLHLKSSEAYVVDESGEASERARIPTTEASLRRWFGGRARMRICIEASGLSPWVGRVLAELGHEVIAANPQRVRLIAESTSMGTVNHDLTNSPGNTGTLQVAEVPLPRLSTRRRVPQPGCSRSSGRWPAQRRAGGAGTAMAVSSSSCARRVAPARCAPSLTTGGASGIAAAFASSCAAAAHRRCAWSAQPSR